MVDYIGNYVIVRKTGMKQWESMPIYARLGLHPFSRYLCLQFTRNQECISCFMGRLRFGSLLGDSYASY